jgi:hypothetical protein
VTGALAERVRIDRNRRVVHDWQKRFILVRKMELRGLEPLTYALPAHRSSQLSYSPVECEVVRKVNA